jgi:hypothetical protein
MQAIKSKKATEIRKAIYQVANVSNSKKFRILFPEFDSYSLQLKVDLAEILGCFESEPEAVAAVLNLIGRGAEVIDLVQWRMDNNKITVGEALDRAIDLNQSIREGFEEVLTFAKSFSF